MPSVQDFAAASERALKFLQGHLGFDLWMVTRVDQDDWIVLTAEDHGYAVKSGAVLQWSDSFCSRMVKGEGPRVAPDASAVPAYAAAPIGQALTIRSYVGVPLKRQDGTLFGTLCAISPERKSPDIAEKLHVVEAVADLLSCLLAAEQEALRLRRQLESVASDARRDGLTGLFNQKAWIECLEIEEARCRRFGDPACIVAIDLDDLKHVNDTLGHQAGDALLVKAAGIIRETVRQHDIVARTGGDEFLVLAVACDEVQVRAVEHRLRVALMAAEIAASVGTAARRPQLTLIEAAARADKAMYEDKGRRKQRAESLR